MGDLSRSLNHEQHDYRVFFATLFTVLVLGIWDHTMVFALSQGIGDQRIGFVFSGFWAYGLGFSVLRFFI